MPRIDKIIGAAVDGVRRSGALTEGAITATVSAVGGDGTLTATRLADTFPRVRILSGYAAPAVGDLVQLLRTAGGWVCVGRLETAPAPQILSGSFSQAVTVAGQWTDNLTITFPAAFAATPVVVVTPQASGPGPGTTNGLQWQCTTVTTTSFAFRQLRDNTGTAVFGYIATTY